MTGGYVTEKILLSDRVWLNCVESQSTTKCAIYVCRDQHSILIEPGDGVWWQGRLAFWTPHPYRRRGNDPIIADYFPAGARQGIDFDIKLLRIGNSGVKRPKL